MTSLPPPTASERAIPGPGQESVWDYPRPPSARVREDPDPEAVTSITEEIRLRLADAWGEMGAAWGVAPAIARVQAYLMARQQPLTEREVREALGRFRICALLPDLEARAVADRGELAQGKADRLAHGGIRSLEGAGHCGGTVGKTGDRAWVKHPLPGQDQRLPPRTGPLHDGKRDLALQQSIGDSGVFERVGQPLGLQAVFARVDGTRDVDGKKECAVAGMARTGKAEEEG